jgi:hypothetical protein
MSSNVPLLPSEEVSRSVPTGVAPSPPWRLKVLRSIAAAHLLVGALEFLKVAGNLALNLPYTGGPLALPGVVTVILARALYALSQGPSPNPEAFQLRTHWIEYQAQTTGNFLGAMMAAHVAVGALNAALGYGLWRRLNWARWLGVVALGLAELLAIAHWAALPWVVGRWPGYAIVVALLLVVPAPVLAFLISPRTGDLFANRDDALPARRKRGWWTLSLQWVVGVLVLALALVLLALFGLGPMVEIVWIAAAFTVDRP